jgi:hypothetical protein
VAVVRTDVSDELSASFIRATRIGGLGTTLVVTLAVFLSPWWRRRYFPPKRRFLQEPHGVTSQKTPFFMWGKCFLVLSLYEYSSTCLHCTVLNWRHRVNVPGFSSRAILGFEPRRIPWPQFSSSLSFTCFQLGFLLGREDVSVYYRPILLYWQLILLALTLTYSLILTK